MLYQRLLYIAPTRYKGDLHILYSVVHSGKVWMRTRADNEFSQNNPDTGTSTEGR